MAQNIAVVIEGDEEILAMTDGTTWHLPMAEAGIFDQDFDSIYRLFQQHGARLMLDQRLTTVGGTGVYIAHIVGSIPEAFQWMAPKNGYGTVESETPPGKYLVDTVTAHILDTLPEVAATVTDNRD